MGRRKRYLPIPGLDKYVVDPDTGRFRDKHGNFVALKDKAGHPYILYKDMKLFADQMVYSAKHGAVPRRKFDKRIGVEYKMVLVHKDRDPSNIVADNLVLVPVDVDGSAFDHLDTMMRQRPHKPGTFRKRETAKVYH